MRVAYNCGMVSTAETVIGEWHAALNSGDAEGAAARVGNRIVVLGPKGAGAITLDEFVAWCERSGIRLVPRSWHPISDALTVVEQDATWPESSEPTRVATVFSLTGGKVTAVLRLPDLSSALELAPVCREMAATQ